MRHRYAVADRKGRSEILDGFVAATGYHRKYAVAVLRQPVNETGSERLFPQRQRIYDQSVQQALICIWNAANQICSKRLAPFLPEFVETLERFGHLSVSAEIKTKLLKLSPASIDRLLKDERKNHQRGISTTRPANLLKQRIKVRTFADWNDTGPGFFEGDLVAHCGDRAEGSFLNSLVVTDVATGWTESVPLIRKCDSDVIAGLETIREVLPMPLLGLDTDNGSEFINNELLAYCEREKITFTRSRAYKKNDQAHIEQKNGSVVRRIVGYDRFEGNEAATAILNLYKVLRLYVNFFQPSTKLLKKTRVGSRTIKSYDEARTPYQRLLDSKYTSSTTKTKLRELYSTLDPVLLFDQLGQLQKALWQEATIDAPQQSVVEIKRADTVTKAPPPVIVKPSLKALKPLRKSKRAYRVAVPHTWRTRKDPLDGTNDYAYLLFQLHPDITSSELFHKLREKYPEKFAGGELKTVQRRLSLWRRQAMRITTLADDTECGANAYQIQTSALAAKALNHSSKSG